MFEKYKIKRQLKKYVKDELTGYEDYIELAEVLKRAGKHKEARILIGIANSELAHKNKLNKILKSI